MADRKRYVLLALAIILGLALLLVHTYSLEHGIVSSTPNRRASSGSGDSGGYEAGSDPDSNIGSRPNSPLPGRADEVTGKDDRQHIAPGVSPHTDGEADEDLPAKLKSLREAGRQCIEVMVSSERTATIRLVREHWIKPKEHAATAFTDDVLLQNNGWVCSFDKIVDGFEKDGDVPIMTAISDLRLSLAFSVHNGPDEVEHQALPHVDRERGINEAVVCQHSQPYSIQGKLYQPTDMEYRFVLNPAQGVIVLYGKADQSPTTVGSSDSKTRRPPLHLWEDVLALEMRAVWDVKEYYRQDHGKPKFEYLFHVNIEPDKALFEATYYALEMHGYDNRGSSKDAAPTRPKAWNGDVSQRVVIKGNSKGAQAIIGTPPGRSTAAFLYRNKAWLGIKQIRSITIFLDDRRKKPQPALLFEIEDVANVDQDPFDRSKGKHGS
ncbi:hypothetical protein LTR86_009875 [Recurvomyces mirabilis]|nr:hypothetical protein LTR86_009875 [Recurvomyces mirabilis]